MHTWAPLLAYVLLAVAAPASALTAPSALPAIYWQTLNFTVGGRLQTAKPVSAPCFASFNGKSVGRDTAACAAVEAGYTSPTYRIEQFGAYMLPQWETCQRAQETCVLDSSNPANPLAWQNYNCSQGSVPPYYIAVQEPLDVVAAYAFSTLTGVPLTVKNTGHDYKGRSSMKDSLALWTHKLQDISYSTSFTPTGCASSKKYAAMTLGAGVPWQTVYDYAEAHGFTAIGGYSQTVGASGGWLLGGGHSILTPVYGLGADRALQFKIVTPDGQYRIANECQNTDLFWALRGGGGSAFGVVLESSQAVVPNAVPLQVASIKFTANGTASQAGWLQLMVEQAETWAQEGWGGHIGPSNLINVTPLLSLAQAQASLALASAYAQAYNGTVVIETLPTWGQFFDKYVPAAQSAVGPQRILGSRLMPTTLFQSTTGRAALTAALVAMLPHASPYIVVGTPAAYNGSFAGGQTSVNSAWYSSLWHMSMHEDWQFNATLVEKIGNFTDTDLVVGTLRTIAPNSGAYINEGDVYEVNHQQSYWGSNYQRLLSIKNKYDPLHLLDCWQCVGWRGSADARYKCYPDILSPN